MTRVLRASKMSSKPRIAVPEELWAQIAMNAKVSAAKLRPLRSLLLSARTEAFRAHVLRGRKRLTIKDVRPHLANLRKALEALQAERKGEVAGIYLGAVIAPQTIDDWLDAVARAKRHAERGLPGRGTPKGPRGATGFDFFTRQVVVHVRLLGGELTCARMSGTDYDKIKGSFIEVIELLRAYLPKGFIPSSGHAIARTFELANKSAI